jgi:transketolase
VLTVDGHDFGALETAFAQVTATGRPTVLVAHTVRGKGLPSIEARADRWFCRFNEDDVATLLEELHGATAKPLEAATLVVR